MSQEVTASSGNETRKALVAGLLLLLLLILAPQHWAERAQKDLGMRAEAALRHQGLDPALIQVRFDGRDALLVASQPHSAELGQARRIVDRVWGVRTVQTRATNDGVSTESGPAPTTPVPPEVPEPTTGTATAGPAEETATASPPPPVPEPVVSATPVEPAAPAPVLPPAVAFLPPASLSGEVRLVPDSATPAEPPPVSEKRSPPEPSPAPETANVASAVPAAPPKAAPAPAPAPEPETANAATSEATVGHPVSEATTQPSESPSESLPPTRTEQIAAEIAPHTEAPEPTPVDVPAVESEPTPVDAAESPPDLATTASTADTEQLLRDWPDLNQVEGLGLEMIENQVWLRGKVYSRAELDRIQAQFPSSAAAQNVRFDIQLADPAPQALADYLNLVAAGFRFRGTTTLGSSGAQAMDRIAETLVSYPQLRFGMMGSAPETANPLVRQVQARHRSGAAYHALLKRGVSPQQLFLADFARPLFPYDKTIPTPAGSGQIQFFVVER